MTFKHIKFEDSVVMRSLEKLAHDKGLVKPEPVTKTASAKKSSQPTSNSLVEKILHLCSQMRQSGFDKQAKELESRLMQYKQANTLYETSSETGNDLVEQAHPKGSHKLEDVDAGELAVIETIIDQQLKNMKMVEKKPTGKLAHKDILKAVKIILAETQDDVWTQLMNKVNFVKSRVQQVYNALGVPYAIGNMILDKLEDPTVDNILKAQEGFRAYYKRVKPGLMLGVSEDLWAQWEPALSRAGFALSDALAIRKKYNSMKAKELTGEAPVESTESAAEPSVRMGTPTKNFAPAATAFIGKLNGALKDLKNWLFVINNDPENSESDIAVATNWINAKLNALNNLKQKFTELGGYADIPTDEQVDAVNESAPGFVITLDKHTADMPKFKSEWIG